MVKLSGRPRRTVALGLPSIHAVRNPVRRGPIVLATDGMSETGGPVVAAQLLAARLELPLEVVTVLDRLPTFRSGTDVIATLDPRADDARRETRETRVRDYVSRFAGGAPPPPVHVRIGSVAAEIARFAGETSATMIVMGAAPHRRLRRMISGERATQVLHSASCPVLSVPPTFTALPKVVVAAVDFGPASTRAVQAALLVVGDGGTVFLTHILPRPVPIPALNIVPESDIAVSMHALFDLLREEIAPSIPAGVNVVTRLVNDDSVDGILASAGELGADLVTVGAHGPGMVARLLGGVAQTILHTAESAVLASPPPPREGATAKPLADPPGDEREHAWAMALDAFTERNLGRIATLQIRDQHIGSYITGHGYTFLGATYEPAAHRLEIMVGDALRPVQHLTRSVMYPEAIVIAPAESGAGEVLDIRYGQGHTIVTVSDAADLDLARATPPAGWR